MNIWEKFQSEFNLSVKQIEQFKAYSNLLINTNKTHNLTAITDEKSILYDHFFDSLSLSKFVDLKNIKSISDIGAGAGFPGIPLKILYPHLNIIFIEVIHKKLDFIKHSLEELDLVQDNLFIDLDWRNFLRKTTYDIDIFCSRAALPPTELIRMFKPSIYYKNNMLVYWASKFYVPSKVEEPFIIKKEEYTIDNKKRDLIFYRNPIDTKDTP